MNIWEYIILFNKAYWWVWAVLALVAILGKMENCPELMDKFLGAAGKFFHIEINMDDEF